MSNIIRYSVADTATEAERQVVEAALRDYNRRSNPDCWSALEDPASAARPLTILAKRGGEVVGGLIGETQFLWLKIHILSVVEGYRKQGIGKQLLVTAEVEAIGRGCKYAYVDTMDYQSPGLYERLGYRIAGQLDNWDSHGHRKYFFRKELEPRGDTVA